MCGFLRRVPQSIHSVHSDCSEWLPPATQTARHTTMATTTTPANPDSLVTYNRVRFDAYRRCANEFVIGETYDCNELANMLHDLRWPEVPRAFSVALYNAACLGPLRPGLARNFKELLEYVTFLAFGSAERDVVQPWYLKNWDDFFVSCVEGILSLNNRADNVLLKRETVVRRAFRGVLTLVEGARGYMSLDRLVHSSAAHALLVAAGHSAHSFVWNGWVQLGGDVDGVPVGCVRDAKRQMTLAHAFLMDEVAKSILDAQSFDVLSWDHAFGHFAGSQKWRSFAERCTFYASRLGAHAIPAVRRLDDEVEHAYLHARNAIRKIHQSVADECHKIHTSKSGWSDARPNKRKATDAASARTVAGSCAPKRRAPSEASAPSMPTTPFAESICYQVVSAIPTSSHTLYSDLGSRKVVC